MANPTVSPAESATASPRLAMLGMIPDNGHPSSWSAIINGYDREAMTQCPFAGIPVYLSGQPHDQVRVPGVQVTHLRTDDPAESSLVDKASLISNIVQRPEDVIGQVHAVIISTVDGTGHVRRAWPFVEAGLRVYIDKPLATTGEEPSTFNTKGQTHVRFADTYQAFRSQLLSYVHFVRSGQALYPFSDNVKMMCVIIAGISSRQENSRRIDVAEIQTLLTQ